MPRLAALFATLLVAPLVLQAWPALAWPERLAGHGGPVRGLAAAPDRPELLSASFDYAIIRWTLRDGAEDAGEAEVSARMIGHEAAVNDVAYVPGTRLAVSASDDGSVGLWDLESGAMVERWMGTGDKVLDVAVSPDGRFAASAGWDQLVRIYDLGARRQVAALKGHDGNVNAVTFSRDSAQLFSGGYDGAVLRWDLATMTAERPLVRHGWGVNIVRILPDGTLLYGATDGVVGLVDLTLGQEFKTLPAHEGPILAAAVDEAGDRVAIGSADGLLRLYDLRDWSVEAEFRTPYGPIWGLALAPDGAALYRAGLDDTVFLWRFGAPFAPLEDEHPRRFKVAASEEMGPGEREFRRKCSVCHTLTPDGGNRAGPTLYGLFGRKAGTVPGYPYSDALEGSDIVWTEETVGKLFEHGPDIFTPGSKMPLQRLKKDLDRDALVAYLKAATDPDAAVKSEGE